MVHNNEGLTKTYNRFHDPDERSPDILKLRELHAAMDRAVLDAYGWTDLKPTCEFLLDESTRLTWAEEARDELLARLAEAESGDGREGGRGGCRVGEAGQEGGREEARREGGDHADPADAARREGVREAPLSAGGATRTVRDKPQSTATERRTQARDGASSRDEAASVRGEAASVRAR